jgi:hypothetical protein
MNGRRVRWLGAILLTTLIAVIVGVVAYRMGLAQGLAFGMAEVEGGREAVHAHAWHARGWYGGYGPWGFGFGFGFLVPLLFFFTWVAVLKMLFWRWGGRGPGGPWRGHWGGPWHRHHQRRRGRGNDRNRDRDFDRGDDRRSFDDGWRHGTTTL